MHLITGLRTGGAENQLLLLTTHSRTDPVVVALTNADEIADALRAGGVPVLDAGMRHNRDLLVLRRLVRLIRTVRPDVVHLHLYRATLYGRVAARLARVPVVVTTEHSLLDGRLEGRPTTTSVRALYMATDRWNDATIAVSDEVAERLARWGVPRRKIHVVPNGVDAVPLRRGVEARDRTRRRLGLPLDAEVIGGVGRLHPDKRWDLLIRALADDLGPHRRILLVGSGQEERALSALAASLGVAPWVHLVGNHPDVGAVLAAMDVVVSTSLQETFGLAMVEAAVAGRPVVYVSSPGLDAVAPVPGAFRVLPEESHIREAVRAALRDPLDPSHAGRLDRYDVRAVARQVDDVYAWCLHSSRRSRGRKEQRVER